MFSCFREASRKRTLAENYIGKVKTVNEKLNKVLFKNFLCINNQEKNHFSCVEISHKFAQYILA